MAGIMPKGGLGPETVPDDAEEQAASPEEQAAIDEFVLNAMELIYEQGDEKGKINPGILELLDEEPSDLKAIITDLGGSGEVPPALRLAAVTAIVALEVRRRYGAEDVPGDVLIHGGAQLLEQLAEIAQEAGIHEYTEGELGEAITAAGELYLRAAGEEGLVDTAALKQEFAEIQMADQEGRFGEAVPAMKGGQAAMGEESDGLRR